jgi:CDP-glycerol glycerophosphotransferase (TagB/SpsB family)
VGAAARIRLFPASSELAAARIRTAFALPADRVPVTGDPRDDVLFTGTPQERSIAARARMSELLGQSVAEARILFYAPTWRDGERDPAVPGPSDWPLIESYLERTGSVLIVRPHPLGVGDYTVGAAGAAHVHLLGSERQGDITPLLPAVDVMITDYSSIVYDYALVGGLSLFLAPDVSAYVASRGLYEPYEEFSGGTEVTTWRGLLELLERSDSDAATRERLRQHTEQLAERAHAFRDGHNTSRVYAEIVSRLAGESPRTAAGPDRAAARAVTVDAVSISEGAGPVLALAGSFVGAAPASVGLAGARLRLTGTLAIAGARWEASIPLVSSRWQGPALPPPSGRYRLVIAGGDSHPLRFAVTAEVPPRLLAPELFALDFEVGHGLGLLLSAPLGEAEQGPARQAELEAEYRRRDVTRENAVFFESYFGHNASCNPRGIDRALAAMRPDIVRYWSVADASVEVPEGAVAVIEGSAEWWRVRGSARLLVVNDWLRKRYRRRKNQTVLQTWHGTPLKRIALTRRGVRPRTAVATMRESSRWDILLAQNDFSARALRRAYAFRGPVWEEGYPRDDVLVTGDPAAVRARLGIPAHVKVVLYAPTWRDDRPGHVDHLDGPSFAKDLGPDYVLLIRAHSRSMRPGNDIRGNGVIDVTSYPDISDLFLVADALVTDYSSVMFDYTVTGKPIYFFAPDLDHYRDELRGFYFDLLAVAPGPVVGTPAELLELLRHPDAHLPSYARRYAAWRARFNPRDDGHAGERVVRRLIAEGRLG